MGKDLSGIVIEHEGTQIGDIAQLSFDGDKFVHTVIIVNIVNANNLNEIFIASHTNDSYNRAISSYGAQKIRFLHINDYTI